MMPVSSELLSYIAVNSESAQGGLLIVRDNAMGLWNIHWSLWKSRTFEVGLDAYIRSTCIGLAMLDPDM